MRRSSWAILSFVLAATLCVAEAAMAEGYYFEPDRPDDSMCQDLTGNWVLCDSMGGDGISGGGGGTIVPTCTRSVCWYCETHAGKPSQCAQTGAAVDGPMGCNCGKDSNGECDLKKTKCSIG